METPADPKSEDAELPAGTDVGGYVVEQKIGEGGMGMVYGARHPQIGKRVAIKVLAPAFCRDPQTVARFEQEARLVNEIHHPNIVDIFQLGQLPDGRKFLVMELLQGESLSDRIDKGPMPARTVMELLDGICDALVSVHERGIVHRDLKSDNIFLVSLRGHTQVKLLDFGLAKLAGHDPKSVMKTKTGIVVGTPSYMAPEQARGKTADHRADIYALGILAYKMLVGKLPFEGAPMQQLIHHLKTPAPSARAAVPDVPEQLSELVRLMMAKFPEERPAMQDIRAVFAALLGGAPVPAYAAASQAMAAAQSQAMAAAAHGSQPAMAAMQSSPAMTPASSSPAVQAASSSPALPAPAAASGPSAMMWVLLVLGVIAVGALSFFIVHTVTQ